MEGRPQTIKRKSSNLLATFARNTNAQPTPTLSPVIERPLPYNSGLVQAQAEAGSPEMGSESQMASFPQVPNALPGTLDGHRAIIQKRIAIWAYLKRVHTTLSGPNDPRRVLWFNTVQLGRMQIEPHFGRQSTPTQRRATRFLILGMSLAPILDVHTPNDYLRALLACLQEFDGLSDEALTRQRTRTGSRPGSRILRARSSAGANSAGISSNGVSHDGDDFSLIFPNLAFELDYFEVLVTLCDMLCEVYTRILAFLGGNSTLPTSPPPLPSASSQSSQNTRFAQSISPTLLDMVVKVDSRIKKLANSITKELDGIARQAVKDELHALEMFAGSESASSLTAEAFDWPAD